MRVTELIEYLQNVLETQGNLKVVSIDPDTFDFTEPILHITHDYDNVPAFLQVEADTSARNTHWVEVAPTREGMYWFYGTNRVKKQWHGDNPEAHIITVKWGASQPFYQQHGAFVFPKDMVGVWYNVPLTLPTYQENE